MSVITDENESVANQENNNDSTKKTNIKATVVLNEETLNDLRFEFDEDIVKKRHHLQDIHFEKVKQRNSVAFSGNNELFFDGIFMLLGKKPYERTARDIQLIYKLLEDTELHSRFKITYNEETSINRLLTNCSVHMTNQFVPKGDYLCKIGEEGDNFFIILKGSVDVMRIASNEVLMDAEEYFLLLQKHYKNNDFYILNETIASNFHLFPIRKYEFNDIDLKIDRLKYKRGLVRKVVKSNETNFNEEFRKAQAKSVLKLEIKKDPEKKDVQYFEYDEEEIQIVQLEKKKCTIHYEELFLKKKKGDYFGDLALDTKAGMRTASCIASEECYVGVLKKEDYINFVKDEKKKLRSREINFLLDYYIFQKVSKGVFDKKYFNEFALFELNKGQILFREGEDVNALYFIREGEVELSLKKSILEINFLLNHLKTNKLKEKVNTSKYKINNEPEDVLFHLKKKQVVKVLAVGPKAYVGGIELFYGMNWLSTCIVISDKAKIYKLSVKSLKMIFGEQLDLPKYFERESILKLTEVIKRMAILKEARLKYIDNNYSVERLVQPKPEKEKSLEIMSLKCLKEVVNQEEQINEGKINKDFFPTQIEGTLRKEQSSIKEEEKDLEEYNEELNDNEADGMSPSQRNNVGQYDSKKVKIVALREKRKHLFEISVFNRNQDQMLSNLKQKIDDVYTKSPFNLHEAIIAKKNSNTEVLPKIREQCRSKSTTNLDLLMNKSREKFNDMILVSNDHDKINSIQIGLHAYKPSKLYDPKKANYTKLPQIKPESTLFKVTKKDGTFYYNSNMEEHSNSNKTTTVGDALDELSRSLFKFKRIVSKAERKNFIKKLKKHE